MGKTTGFLEYKRKKPTEESVKTRLKHYREFTRSLDEDDLANQGARCMDCGIPFCHSSFGCPVLNPPSQTSQQMSFGVENIPV